MSLRSRTAPRLLINVITISDRRVSPSGRSFTFWAISLPVCAHVVAAETERSSHKVYEKDKIGEVQIADEVVAIIAGLAATEVDGVDSMAGNITNELVGKLGMKNLSKGVKVEVTEEHVSVNMALNLKYGYSIPDVCEKVQEKVKNAIENMTGLTVLDVNIKIAGVSLEEK